MTMRRPARHYTPRRRGQPPPAEERALEQRCRQIDRRLGVAAIAQGGESARPIVEQARARVAKLADPAARLAVLVEAAGEARRALGLPLDNYVLPDFRDWIEEK